MHGCNFIAVTLANSDAKDSFKFVAPKVLLLILLFLQVIKVIIQRET